MMNISKVKIWTHPEEDHELWLKKCQGSGTWKEHCRRLKLAVETVKQQGMQCEIVKIGVREMLAALKKLGKPNDQVGRAEVAARWKAKGRPKKCETIMFSVRLPVDLAGMIDDECEETGRTKVSIIESGLRLYFKKAKP